MSEKYLPQLAALEKSCFSEPWSQDAFKTELSKENALFLLALNNEKVLGYIGSYFVLEECYITNIAVCFEARKKKIATKLLNRLIDIMTAKNKCRSISLEVRESNIPAINLYRKFNFQKVGFRKKFYRNPTESAYIMTWFKPTTSL